MASNDKLWFELGVRDEISKVLNSLIGKAEGLRRAMTLSDKDLGFGNAQKNALDLEAALVDVGTTLKKIRAQKGYLVDPEDIKTADKMERKFKQMFTALTKLQREIKAKLKNEGLNAIESLDVKGLVQNILNEKGFSLAQSQVNTFLSENEKKMNDASKAAIGLATAYDKVVASGKNTNSMLKQLGMQLASTFSLYAIEGLVKNIITIGGEFEIQHKALQNILGDVQQANTLFAQLKSLAVESPFSFKQEVTYSKQLAAFNIPYKEIFDTTKRLGDLSAGLGVDMNRLILAYGQVRSAAVLRGQELRQFTEAGIPMVQALADEFTKLNGKVVTTGEVFSLISKRAVPFEMVKKVLWDMTNEGGRFYNMQFELADTLAGKWSNLRDAWEIMLSDFAKGSSTGGEALKFLVSTTTTLIKSMNALSPLIWGVIGGLSAAKGLSFLENVFTVGLTTMKRNVIEAQRLNAVEIQRRFILGEIDAERKRELLQQNQSLQNSMNQLVISGRMSTLQMARAYKEGLITKEYLVQAREMGIINAREYQAVVTGNQRLLLQQRISKAMNIGWTGWTGVAIMAGISIYQAYSQWANSIEQQVDSVIEGAKNKSKELGNIIEQNEKVGIPEEREDLRSRIKQMREVLENSDAYTASIDAQVMRAKDLTEQYEILLKAIKEAKAQSDFTVQHKGDIENMIKASSSQFQGGWDWAKLATFGLWDIATGENTWDNFFDFFFNDDINKNFKQFDEALTNLNNQKTLLSSYKDEYVSAIDAMRKHYSKFAEETKNMSPEKALEYLSQNDTWLRVFEKQLGDGEKKLAGLVEKLGEYAQDASEKRNELIEDDANKMFSSYAATLGMNLEQYKEYCKNHEGYTKQMITSIVASLNEGGQEAKTKLANALLEFFGLASNAQEGKNIAQDARRKVYNDQTTQGRHVLGTLMKGAKERGWGDKNGNGIWDVQWINKYFGNGVGYVAGIDAMKNKWNELKEEREAAHRSGAKLSEREEKEWQRLSKAAEIYDFKSKKSKLFESGKKDGKDEQAKELRNYMRVLSDSEKSYQYWRKNAGDSAAALHVNSEFGDELSRIGDIMEKMGKLPKGSVFKFESVEQYKQALKDLKDYYQNIYDTSGKSRPELLQAIKEVDKVIADIERKDFEKQVSDFTSRLKAELDALTKAWDVFKQVRDATGNVELAQEISGVSYKSGKVLNIADALKENIKKSFASAGVAEIPFDINLSEEEYKRRIQNSFAATRPVAPTQGNGESDADFKKRYEDYEKQLSLYEAKIASFVNSYGEWQKLQKAVISSDIATFAGLLGAVNDYDSQIRKIDDELKKTIEANNNLVKSGVIKQGQADKANGIATTQAEDKKWKLSSLYINLMNNSLALTKTEIEQGLIRAQDILNEKLRKGLVTAKEYADEMAKLKSIQQNWDKSSVFGKSNVLTSYLTGGESGVRNYLTGTISKYNVIKANGGTLTKEENKQYNQALDTQKGLDKLDKSVGKTKVVFDSLAGTLQPVVEIFNQLGMTGIGQVVSGVQGALGGAASGGMAGMALFGAAGGPWGAAIGAGLSVASTVLGGILSAHDDALQDEIDASKQRQKEMERLYKYTEKALEKVLGGLYTFAESETTEKERKQVVEEYNKRKSKDEEADRYAMEVVKAAERGLPMMASMFASMSSSLRKQAGPKDTVEAFKKAAETQEYYDIQRASLLAQRDELIKQRESEQDKKDSDDEAIDSYNQQIRELQDSLETFALDMAKALYDIDLKDWASQLTDAIVEAWEKGEDAAEAYRKKVREIVKDLTKNMLAQKVVEAAFKTSGLDKMITNMMDAKSGVLNEKDFMQLADGLNTVAETTAKTITGVLDALDAKGYVDKGDGSSSGVSSNIKSITEQTADLLASYINAIRADVSVNRATLTLILNAVQGQSQMPALAEAQLQQLQTIVTLARQRNELVTEMRDMLHKVETGQTQISIK